MPRLFVSLCCVAACAATAQAGPARSGQPLTLADALSLAAARYPAIRAAMEQQAAAQDAIGVAKTAYLPRADMLWQESRSTTNKPNVALLPQAIVPVPDTPARVEEGRSDWNSAGGVLLSWQPFDFGQRGARINVARQGAAAARQGTGVTRLAVASATASAYFDVAAAQQLVQVAQANLDRMQTFTQAVHVLVDNKLRAGADASQADAELALARTQLIETQTQEKVRLDALANLLQSAPENVSIRAEGLLEAPPAEDLQATPIASHPAVEQQAALVEQQKASLTALSRSYAPVFYLYGSASGLGSGLSSSTSFEAGSSGLAPGQFNWLVAAQVTFPALEIFTIHEQKKQQQEIERSQEAQYRQTLSDLSTQARQAMEVLDGARRIARNTPTELAAARAGEQQQRTRYQSSLATVVEVAVAESLLRQAEADDALARLSVWRALAGLAIARGDITPFLNVMRK
ncbi:MAG TPA: TolC family protein [Acidobacteriaceae bacterium]|nr:TolC family protein [Acidobacteriaceae bacterium]